MARVIRSPALVVTVLLGAGAAAAAASCLPEAVPWEARKEVVVDGERQPLGIWAFTWQSAALNFAIFELLAGEVLGYKTRETNRSGVVVSGLWAIAGCDVVISTRSGAEASCELRQGKAVSRTHLNFETWDYYLPATLKALETATFSHRKPVNLGTLGFRGVSANWLPQEAFEAGMSEGPPDRIALDVFRSYNSTNWNAAKYFDSLDAINTTEFFSSASRCADYPPMNEHLDALNYLNHFPTDADGVESYIAADGAVKLRGRCEDGVWWLSPACRASRSRCIPWISVEGWGYNNMWHKATYYNMAIAIASTNSYVDVIHKKRVLNYAWIPDSTFIARRLQQVIFPGYSKEQHDQQLYITEFAQVETEKWAHRDLETSAPSVWGTAINMKITTSTLMALLEHQHINRLTDQEAACYFLRTQRSLWEAWIPLLTNCLVGQGLYTNTAGEYECRWCPRATASEAGTVPGTNISTRICVPCAEGEFQSNTQSSECLPCDPGTMTDTVGSEACRRCAQGLYQPASGATACLTCPGTRTTLIQAAATQADCVCQEGGYEPAGVSCQTGSDTCPCSQCSEGMLCPKASRFDAILAFDGVNSSIPAANAPHVLPGYYTEPREPMSVYMCATEVACPGGRPGACSGGRAGLTCAKCSDGYYAFSGADGACRKCDKGHGVLLFAFTLLCIVGLTALHVGVNWPISRSSSMTMSCVFLGGMAVTTVLTFNVYANFDFVATSPLADLFRLLKVFAFDLEVVRFTCVAGTHSQLVRYSVKLLSLPFAFVLMALGVALLSRFKPLRHHASFNAAAMQNSMGMIMSVFFIAVSLASLEAFRCHKHPNERYSLSSDRSVLCFESSTHRHLVFMSAAAILIYPIPFLAITCLATLRYSWLVKNYGTFFTMRMRFLFNRMSPERFYFGFWYNMRNFFLTLVPVIAPNHYAVQVFLCALVFLVWLVVQLMFLPWRFAVLNKFDTYTTVMHILVLQVFAILGGTYRHTDVRVTAGLAIIALFTITLVGLLSGCVKVMAPRCLRHKEFLFFLSHHKGSAGIFARQLKMMLASLAPRKIFLDVDELDNLDNIAFTVRSNTENLIVLMTPEALHRLWVSVEITSAYLNNVPIHVVNVSMENSPRLTEAFLADVPNMWSWSDTVEMHNVGLDILDVQLAYRHLAILPNYALPMGAPFDEQLMQTKELVSAALPFPPSRTSRRDSMVEQECCALIGFDTDSQAQVCAGRVLYMLFERKHWTVYFGTDVKDEPVRLRRSVGVMLISKGILTNSDALGFVTLLFVMQTPLVSTLSGENFWKPDNDFLSGLRSNFGLPAGMWDAVQAYAPGASGQDIADSLFHLYKILAWRFSPQDSEVVMRMEFNCILERTELEHQRRRGPSREMGDMQTSASSQGGCPDMQSTSTSTRGGGSVTQAIMPGGGLAMMGRTPSEEDVN